MTGASVRGPIRRDRLLLAVLVLGLAAAKVAYNPLLDHESLDGDYYYQISRNVAEGVGFKTGVSILHQGLKELPGHTTIYPLWPLLLGWSGRAIGLDTAALLLPELLFVVSLILVYGLTNRVCSAFDRWSPGRGPPSAINPGHLVVLILGTSPVYFRYTSLPYTEALALTLTFLALLVVERGSERVGWAAVAGVLAGMAFLARSQNVGLIVAIPAAYLLASGVRQGTRLALAALIGAAIAIGPYLTFLWTWTAPPPATAVVLIDQYRETPELTPFMMSVPTESVWHHLRDRLTGVVVAFNPAHPESYVSSFGLAVYAVPVAMVSLVWSQRSRLSGWPARELVLPLAVVISGVLLLLPVHEAHLTTSNYEWLFGHRHGLPFVLLLVAALGYLGRRTRPWLAACVVLTALSSVTGVAGTVGRPVNDPTDGFTDAERALATWLDEQPRGTMALTTHAHGLSVLTRTGLHWAACQGSTEDTRAFVEHVGVDLVLVYPGEWACPQFAALKSTSESVRVFDDGLRRIEVVRPRRDRPDRGSGP